MDYSQKPSPFLMMNQSPTKVSSNRKLPLKKGIRQQLNRLHSITNTPHLHEMKRIAAQGRVIDKIRKNSKWSISQTKKQNLNVSLRPSISHNFLIRHQNRASFVTGKPLREPSSTFYRHRRQSEETVDSQVNNKESEIERLYSSKKKFSQQKIHSKGLHKRGNSLFASLNPKINEISEEDISPASKFSTSKTMGIKKKVITKSFSTLPISTFSKNEL